MFELLHVFEARVWIAENEVHFLGPHDLRNRQYDLLKQTSLKFESVSVSNTMNSHRH